MTERERWIVYPLLFFALGASLRDKFLQQVSTKELHCQRVVAEQVICEDISVHDAEKPNRVVAQLTSARPSQPDQQTADRFGALILRDSQNKELCSVINDTLQVRRIACEEVSVINPQNQQLLARLAPAPVKNADGSTRYFGSLLLIDSEGKHLFGMVNDQMEMRSIACQSVVILDPTAPGNQKRVLAALGSDLVKPESKDEKPRRVGVLELNGQRLGPPAS